MEASILLIVISMTNIYKRANKIKQPTTRKVFDLTTEILTPNLTGIGELLANKLNLHVCKVKLGIPSV